MTAKILMPALSPTMTEGSINQWLVEIGDKVKAGDIIGVREKSKSLEAISDSLSGGRANRYSW